MERQSMPNFIKKRAFLTPDRPALHFNGVTYTFLEVYEKAYRIAGQLTANGMKKDQFVGLLLKNHPHTVFIMYACHLIGIKVVILNNRLTANELIWHLRDSQAEFLLTEESFNLLSEEVERSLPHIVAMTKDSLFECESAQPSLIEDVYLDDICTVMYTSGTTGHPKGVLQTYGNHWWSAIGSALNLGLHEKDGWLCAVPLFHISGYSILMRSLVYGMKIVLFDSFDEKKIIQAIETEKVTIMSVVSTMLVKIVDQLGEQMLPPHFRCMLLGGGPASESLLNICKEKQIPVFQTYGMTETSSQIVTLAPEYSLSKLGSAGKVLFPSELKIIDEHRNEVKRNEPGQIVVKGPNVTSGYLNRDDETKAKIIDGWLSTGDLGYVDDSGFLYVLDRRSDLIISGGENVYPAEIESVLASHPQIADAGVIGQKNDVWGEVPVAFVAVNGNGRVTEDEIISYCRQHLAPYKIPKTILFITMIPRNAAKKILRRTLREFLDERMV